jgi:hypothetical protein
MVSSDWCMVSGGQRIEEGIRREGIKLRGMAIPFFCVKNSTGGFQNTSTIANNFVLLLLPFFSYLKRRKGGRAEPSPRPARIQSRPALSSTGGPLSGTEAGEEAAEAAELTWVIRWPVSPPQD